MKTPGPNCRDGRRGVSFGRMNGSPIFLLSPAHAGGKRAQTLLKPDTGSAVGKRLHRGEAVPLGEVFSFVSGLYFRGKLAYASRFAASDDILVITPHRGLLPASTPVSLADLAEHSQIDIDIDNEEYRRPLEIDLAGLAMGGRTRPVIFLGSLASRKYVGVLQGALPGRLLFPTSFVGLGDMSRGALLLRHAKAGVELDYAPIEELSRHSRPKQREGGGNS